MKKHIAKGVTKSIAKVVKKPEVKGVKKLLLFQKKDLKSGSKCYYYLQVFSINVCDFSLKLEEAGSL